MPRRSERLQSLELIICNAVQHGVAVNQSISTNIHDVHGGPSLTRVPDVSWRPSTTDLRRSLPDFGVRTIEQPPFIHSDSMTRARGRYSTSCDRHTYSTVASTTMMMIYRRARAHDTLLLFRDVRERPHASQVSSTTVCTFITARNRSPSGRPPRQPSMSTAVDRQATTTFSTCRSKRDHDIPDDVASPSVTILSWYILNLFSRE